MDKICKCGHVFYSHIYVTDEGLIYCSECESYGDECETQLEVKKE